MMAMSVWTADAALAGYVEMHSAAPGSMSATEMDDVWQWLQEKDGKVH